MRNNPFFLIIICTLTFSFSNLTYSFISLPDSPFLLSSYTLHSPINITSDEDFLSLGFSGDGSASNPFIIENLLINSSAQWSIHIVSTTKHFIIRNCMLSSADIGIYIEDVAPGTALIENNIITSSLFGIVLSASYVTVTSNTIEGIAYDGITLHDSSNIVLSLNLIDGSEIGVRLISSQFVQIMNNTITNNLYGNQNHLSSDVVYHYNLFSNNTHHAIILEKNSNNSVISYNDFIDNNMDGVSQAYDDGYNNSWYDRETLEGNYWSDWIGKEFYPIEGSAGSLDNYPLYYPVHANIEQTPVRSLAPSIFIPLMLLAYFIKKRRFFKR